MERYHIFKLGLAILFYATYCVRPLTVHGLKADKLDQTKKTTIATDDYFQYFQGVDGKPGRDYPSYSYIPRTAFTCRNLKSGYYADLETECQVFHICEDGKKISFLCPNGTIFQQSELICEWWNKVNCTNSPNLYDESAEKLQNDIARRKALRKPPLNGAETNHGAVMRTEERVSTRTRYNKPAQNRANHRIPNNNDIEEHIEESNNRHLANAQRNVNQIKQTTDKALNTVKPTQAKKNREEFNTNLQNHNLNPQPNRQVKKIDLSSKPSFGFGEKVEKNGVSFRGNTKYGFKTEYGSFNDNKEAVNVPKNNENNHVSNSKSEINTRNYFSTTQSVYSKNYTPANHKEEVHSSFNEPKHNDNTRTTNSQSELKTTNYFATRQSVHSKNAATTNHKQQTYGSFNIKKEVINNTPQNTIINNRDSNSKSDINSNSYFETTQNINSKSNTPTNHKEEVHEKLTVSDNYNVPFGARNPEITQTTQTPTSKSQQGSPNGDYNLPFPTHKSEVEHSTVSVQSVQETPNSNNIFNHRLDVTQGTSRTNDIVTQRGTEADSSSHELESQVPQESSSFIKSSFNSIKDSSYKPTTSAYNHRATYSEVKGLSFLEAPKISAISSITPHLVTTQPINNGRPFIGSRVGVNTLNPNEPTTQSKYTYLPRVDTSSKTSISELFNIGNTDKTLLPIETSTAVTNPVPTEPFNVGNTDSTFTPNIVSNYHTESPQAPLFVTVPPDGSLNIGREPVNEPPFIKKTVPLLYNAENTERSIDKATVYGTYLSSSSNTPYSPTVPTITESYTVYGSPRVSSGRAVPIKFDKGQDRVSLQLTKNVFGEDKSSQKPQEYVRFNTQVRVKEEPTTNPVSSTVQNGFFVTTPSKIDKPRPFSRNSDFVQNYTKHNFKKNEKSIPTNFPSYEISSARPFEISGTTEATPFTTTQPTTTFSVYDNVDNMINVLQEIASYNANGNDQSDSSRPGLVIPPSVGPQTLHSLAQYFANEIQQMQTEDFEGDSKDTLTNLLTAMTVHGYNNLFNVGSTSTPIPQTTTSDSVTGILTDSRIGAESNKTTSTNEATEANNDDILTSTALPELRQLARNFSIALSSYLNDPDNFRKTLEGYRPTEPPPLEGADATDNISNADEELLNFSDQDSKPTTTTVSPSSSWGFVIASGGDKPVPDDVKNSIGSDLNTADSQSFVPRFNNLQVNEKPQEKASTDLPPDHWTTSTRATTLWQKTLSVNPAIVNGHFETTPQTLHSEEETTEPELFNTDALPNVGQVQSEIKYDLRELPPITLNSTQVHGILIDFMNHTKLDDHNRLHRILTKLNTTEKDFLDRMKEIESNPLTKRLILLLISECGADITKTLAPDTSSEAAQPGSIEAKNRDNHDLGALVHGHLNEDQQDARALQLLNSLYTIASRFGKRR